MIGNDCNNFLVDEGIPRKNGHYASQRYSHDAVYHPFLGYSSIPQKLLQSFLKLCNSMKIEWMLNISIKKLMMPTSIILQRFRLVSWINKFRIHFQEKICEDSSSFDLTPGDLATAIEELNKLAQKLVDMATNEEHSIVEATDSSIMPGTRF